MQCPRRVPPVRPHASAPLQNHGFMRRDQTKRGLTMLPAVHREGKTAAGGFVKLHGGVFGEVYLISFAREKSSQRGKTETCGRSCRRAMIQQRTILGLRTINESNTRVHATRIIGQRSSLYRHLRHACSQHAHPSHGPDPNGHSPAPLSISTP